MPPESSSFLYALSGLFAGGAGWSLRWTASVAVPYQALSDFSLQMLAMNCHRRMGTLLGPLIGPSQSTFRSYIFLTVLIGSSFHHRHLVIIIALFVPRESSLPPKYVPRTPRIYRNDSRARQYRTFKSILAA